MKNPKKSLTLLELALVIAVIIIAVVPSYQAFVQALSLSDYAKEVDIAVGDASDVLEKIKAVSFSNVTSGFPNNTAISPAVIGGFLLSGETIIVRYPNGTLADPLPIQVEVRWSGRAGRQQAEVFNTIRTKTL